MLFMTIVIVSCIVNSLQLSVVIVILPLSLSSSNYALNIIMLFPQNILFCIASKKIGDVVILIIPTIMQLHQVRIVYTIKYRRHHISIVITLAINVFRILKN